MPVEVVMPRLGWDMQVGRLAEWLKHDGDQVAVGDAICTIEGDKATSELESLDSGVLRIPPDSPPPGEEVPVGTLLAYLVAPGEAVPFATPEQPVRGGPSTTPAAGSAPVPGGQPPPGSLPAALPSVMSGGAPSVEVGAPRIVATPTTASAAGAGPPLGATADDVVAASPGQPYAPAAGSVPPTGDAPVTGSMTPAPTGGAATGLRGPHPSGAGGAAAAVSAGGAPLGAGQARGSGSAAPRQVASPRARRA
ncbi:MAG: hypothetical protein JO023_13660, partial [Chloroflexi bacterium]|nr:hypothetical protein [Chloroflexota bacterium]